MALEAQRSFEVRMLELLPIVIEASKHPIPRKEAERLIEEENNLHVALVAGGISQKEYEERMGGPRPNEVEFDTLAEFSYCVRYLGLPKERVQAIIEHENAHANTAESGGAIAWYKLIFVVEEDGQLGVFPMTAYAPRADISPSEFDVMHEQVTTAPNSLSLIDERELEKIRGRKGPIKEN